MIDGVWSGSATIDSPNPSAHFCRPRLRVLLAAAFLPGFSNRSEEGGREELAELRPRRRSSSATRMVRRSLSARRRAFSARRAWLSALSSATWLRRRVFWSWSTPISASSSSREAVSRPDGMATIVPDLSPCCQTNPPTECLRLRPW